MEIVEQIRQSFVQQFQDDDWHVTDVRPSTDEQYINYGRQFDALGTYVVEMTAMRNVDGLNKHGHYNKAPKDTKVLSTFWLFSDGKLKEAYTQILPTPKVSTALTINCEDPALQGRNWAEISGLQPHSSGRGWILE